MLSSKVALVTGAAQGIGLVTSRHLLRNGAKVSMLDVSEKIGQSACRELQKEFRPSDVTFMTTDVTNSEQLRAAFVQTKQRFGKIDIVCNNAGISNEAQWKKMININLVAMIEGTFLALEYMSTRKGGQGGVVVNVASMAGLIPAPMGPTYAASKSGVVGFCRSMKARHEIDGVRINCICPEFVKTAMVMDSMETSSESAKAFIKSVGLLSPEMVADGILELITDTSRAGDVMAVRLSYKNNREYFRLPGDHYKDLPPAKL